jgi:hypothetical protein
MSNLETYNRIFVETFEVSVDTRPGILSII